MRILVVEDETTIAEVIQEMLSFEGYAVDVVATGEEGERWAESICYDLVILDIVLPGKNGFEVCRTLRQKKTKIPIMMLSGKRMDDQDMIHGLDCGADEYFLKPISQRLLSARVRALLRKQTVSKNPKLEIGNLILDTIYHQVWQGLKEIVLTAKEFALFEYLAYHPNIIITRTELEQHVWNESLDCSSNIVDQHIKNLRLKPGKENEKMIQTIRGIGYKLKISK